MIVLDSFMHFDEGTLACNHQYIGTVNILLELWKNMGLTSSFKLIEMNKRITKVIT